MILLSEGQARWGRMDGSFCRRVEPAGGVWMAPSAGGLSPLGAYGCRERQSSSRRLITSSIMKAGVDAPADTPAIR